MADDFSAISKMVYSGRGITFGMTPEGNPFIGYSLTGRSASSQARRLAYHPEDSTVRTEVTDVEQLRKGNPLLLIYPAVAHVNGFLIASNGAQTRLLIDASKTNKDPGDVLTNAFINPVIESGIDITSYEPDSPNFTPRISACMSKHQGEFYLAKKGSNGEAKPVWGRFNLVLGRARLITTYKGGNESPLLPFNENALPVRISSISSQEICQSLYNAIGPKDGDNFRVAAAVMMIKPNGLEAAVMNRSEIGE